MDSMELSMSLGMPRVGLGFVAGAGGVVAWLSFVQRYHGLRVMKTRTQSYENTRRYYKNDYV